MVDDREMQSLLDRISDHEIRLRSLELRVWALLGVFTFLAFAVPIVLRLLHLT